MTKLKLFALLVLVTCLTSATAFARPELPYSDVSLMHPDHNTLEFMYNRNIMTGYPDGTFQPDKVLNRAELLKIIVSSTYDESQYNSYDSQNCFDDIDGTQWYVKYVCYGKAMGIVEGYPDGTFRPERDVNLVEALKMMLVGMNVEIQYSTSSEWYQSYYDTANAHYLIPDGLENQYTNDLSRVQAGEVIKGIIGLDADIVQPQIYTSEGGYEPGTVYIGYLQHGNILDLYFVADSNIESYSNDNVGFALQESGLLDFSIDKQASFVYPGEDVATWYMGLTVTPLRANEVRHIVTLYLDAANPVTILTD